MGIGPIRTAAAPALMGIGPIRAAAAPGGVPAGFGGVRAEAAAVEPLRARRQQQRARGEQQQLQVEEGGIVLDIEQIHLELFLIGGVVAPEDLRIAGEPGLDLHAVAELRHAAAVIIDVFDALGPRADERHLAAQDVEKLRQLVDARAAQDAAHGRDARVVLHGELRAVRLRVHDHGAELDEGETLAVARIALLAKEHRPAVVRLDGDGRGEHERAGHEDADEREHDIHQPLDGQLLDVHGAVAAQVHERIAHERLLRAVEQDVLHRGDDEQALVPLEAVIHQPQAQPCADAADDDGGIRRKLLEQRRCILLVRMQHGGDAVAFAHRLKLAQHLRLVALAADDERRVAHRAQAVIQAVAQQQQQRAGAPLRKLHQQQRQQRQQRLGREREHEIDDAVGQEHRDEQRRHELPQADDADGKAAVQRREQQKHRQVQHREHHKPPEVEIRLRVVAHRRVQERGKQRGRDRRLDEEDHAVLEFSDRPALQIPLLPAGTGGSCARRPAAMKPIDSRLYHIIYRALWQSCDAFCARERLRRAGRRSCPRQAQTGRQPACAARPRGRGCQRGARMLC